MVSGQQRGIQLSQRLIQKNSVLRIQRGQKGCQTFLCFSGIYKLGMGGNFPLPLHSYIHPDILLPSVRGLAGVGTKEL